MQLFQSPEYNFIGSRKTALYFSLAFFCVGLVALLINGGPNWSIDLVGGTVVQLQFEQPIQDDIGTIRTIVNNLGFGLAEVKTIGSAQDNEIQITLKKQSGEAVVGDAVKDGLRNGLPDNSFEVRREEKIGPKIGSELQRNTLIAFLLSLVAIVIYIGIRFHFPFGVAAILALFHDVSLTLGVFAIADLFPGVNAEISLPVIAALLTIIGYSLNDTIVVFDRIRENLSGTMMKKSFEDKVNASINQCLSRTIITSITTLVVVLSIFVVFLRSGDVLFGFSLALLVGVIIGTYSSIYIASPVLIAWNNKWPIK